jgi:hypothetical protein
MASILWEDPRSGIDKRKSLLMASITSGESKIFTREIPSTIGLSIADYTTAQKGSGVIKTSQELFGV